ADGRGEVRRIHDRQWLTLGDLVILCNEEARHRTGEGCQHACGLVVVEVNRSGGLQSAVKVGRHNRIELNVVPLCVRQSHIARSHGRGVVAPPGGTAAEGEEGSHCCACSGAIWHDYPRLDPAGATSRRPVPETTPPCRHSGWPEPARG